MASSTCETWWFSVQALYRPVALCKRCQARLAFIIQCRQSTDTNETIDTTPFFAYYSYCYFGKLLYYIRTPWCKNHTLRQNCAGKSAGKKMRNRDLCQKRTRAMPSRSSRWQGRIIRNEQDLCLPISSIAEKIFPKSDESDKWRTQNKFRSQ